ncbi:ribosome-releasing factor 2, mitochondrial [Tetranychus urticae]|uniref:Tr-type G domain-containing protein n=1 Tax=Tetranychus urticae TaxID=32264 RepID=T1K2N4_TETUR|nr:ribosome-releasing factor 2, mitochondrial [Tetranychus urticae]
MFSRKIKPFFHPFIRFSLNQSSKCSSLKAATSSIDDSISKIRNVGFIAHIDAGKTTTTERLLYYSGRSSSMGEVHQGDTVTDYMVQERERGITITSASTTFLWKKHKVNLLDTPGHVDFIIEVERCLNVLDSAIVILDSASGVEAQTTTVWQQANRYNLPRIIYANKMDRPNANLNMCLESLSKLNANPVLVHLPFYVEKRFTGLIDLPTLSLYSWANSSSNDDGSNFSVEQLTKDHPSWHESLQAREKLIEILSDCDNDNEQLSESVITASISQIPSSIIINSIRRSVLRNRLNPVLLGSSYKKIGVQPLLDAFLRYLPSPVERPNALSKYYADNFCASAFKVIHHENFGPLTFLRLYSGSLTYPTKVYNINRNISEKITRIFIPFADQFKETQTAKFGDIVAVSGLSKTVTGDTLTISEKIADQARKSYAQDNSLQLDECKPVFAGIQIPDPVFFCTIEAPSRSKQKDLDKALENLTREDPSLTVTNDTNSGQTILSGMGELHLEIVKDRILREYKVDAELGPLRISYRETPLTSSEETKSVNKAFGGVNNFVSMKLGIHPSSRSDSKFNLKVVVTQDNDLGKLRTDRLKAIENGIEMGLSFGPLCSFPVIGVDVELLEFRCSRATLQSFVSSVASETILAALSKASMALLEPIMLLEITLPNKYYGKVLSDISNRRGQLLNEINRTGDYRTIEALTPLSELYSYSSYLRTLTSGTAILSMKLDSYQKMNSSQQEKVLEKLKEI